MTHNYIRRALDLKAITARKSCFLFGPRQTGKSCLIDNTLDTSQVIDLLDHEVFLRLHTKPNALLSYIKDQRQLVVIDEIQRVPELLNEIHRLIERQNIRFLMTGSNARKLRKKGVNLLGGRASSCRLHPFVFQEIKTHFDLKKVLHFGSLPPVFFSADPWDELKAYVGEYLKEEIISEAATRNLPAFTRFLEVAALTNGQLINYEKIANDAQVSRSTVQNYYQLLRDTLIGVDLEAYRKTSTRKVIVTHKFFFFDLGIVNYLKNQKFLSETSSDFGLAFEAYIHHELSSYCDYFSGHSLNYWQSQSGHEVDFLIDENIGIEVKSSKNIGLSDIKGLLALDQDKKLKRKIVVCRESTPRLLKGVEILPIEIFLQHLWNNDL